MMIEEQLTLRTNNGTSTSNWHNLRSIVWPQTRGCWASHCPNGGGGGGGNNSDVQWSQIGLGLEVQTPVMTEGVVKEEARRHRSRTKNFRSTSPQATYQCSSNNCQGSWGIFQLHSHKYWPPSLHSLKLDIFLSLLSLLQLHLLTSCCRRKFSLLLSL